MNPISLIIIAAAAILAAALLWPRLRVLAFAIGLNLRMLARRRSILAHRRATANAEGSVGTHDCAVTRLSSAAIATRHLLFAQGADADHIAVADATTPALGTVADEAGAAEEAVHLNLLGKGPTKKVVAAGAITLGTHRVVYQAAGGKVASSGTIIVGVPITGASADGDVIEIADIPPVTISNPGVAASLFDAHTILYATTDNTPAALTVAEQRVVGRITGGNIAALTPAQLWTILNDAFGSLYSITAPVAAAGSTVADAGQLGAANVVHLTSDSAAKGVKLGTGALGDLVFVINDSSTAAELYAASGGTVNGLSADASVVVPASKGLLCFCTAADTWIAFDLPAKATAS